MMDHILNFDWNYREPEEYFIRPEDLDNSVTERILRNKFKDPLISSDEEDDKKPIQIDWDAIFAKRVSNQTEHRTFVPGLHSGPLHPKLSALTGQQHYHCLKVICAQYPLVLPAVFIPRPTKQDHRIFQEVKETYAKEQKEYIDWAKTVWTSDHCRRALRPKPPVETIYEADFRIREMEMQSFPKKLLMAAQIPLETSNKDEFEMVLQKDLISVNIQELPQVDCPQQIKSRLSILNPPSVPEPCAQHPCRFILPLEDRVTDKSLLEVHRSLAQFALDNGSRYIASEGALRCLVDHELPWMLPLSVVDLVDSDGEPCNVTVLGKEFNLLKECAQTRTYKAFKHLLGPALIPGEEMAKLRYSIKARRVSKDTKDSSRTNASFQVFQDVESSDDEDRMVIAADDDSELGSPKAKKKKLDHEQEEQTDASKSRRSSDLNVSGKPECTCKETLFEYPPPRSYKKWRLKNKTTQEAFDIIIHCAHKVRGKVEEIVLEPMPEYQVELGGSARRAGSARGLALALLLRRGALLAGVRVEAPAGNIVTFECSSANQFNQEHTEALPHVANILHCTLAQLQGLRPGHYVFKHDVIHGANAILYAPGEGAGEQLVLNFDATQLQEPDEAKTVKTPPTLEPVLLPYHKYRRVPPLAFTAQPQHVARAPPRPAARLRTPPRALQSVDGEAASGRPGKWPKKKGKKRKK